MKKARLRTRICFGSGLTLLALCFLGESPAGQAYLLGTPSKDHWVADDQAMGAGLAPIVYGFAPGVIFLGVACVLYIGDRRRRAKITT
jgi:hypothetical protein